MRSRHIVGTAVLVAVFLPMAANAQQGRASRDAIARAADSLAQAVLGRGRVAGMAIAVIRGSDTVVMKGYGSADLENDVPASAQTVYRIGSVTKQFTSVASMQLVEQGKISLDDDVTKHIPGYQVDGQPAVRLMKQSAPDTYTAVGQPGRIMFDIANGAAAGFVIDRGARPLEAVRVP